MISLLDVEAANKLKYSDIPILIPLKLITYSFQIPSNNNIPHYQCRAILLKE